MATTENKTMMCKSMCALRMIQLAQSTSMAHAPSAQMAIRKNITKTSTSTNAKRMTLSVQSTAMAHAQSAQKATPRDTIQTHMSIIVMKNQIALNGNTDIAENANLVSREPRIVTHIARNAIDIQIILLELYNC